MSRKPIKLILDSNCILIGARNKLRNTIKKKLTLINPKYTGAFKSGRDARFIPKFVYFYEESETTLIIPKGVASQVCQMCIKDSSRPIETIDNQTIREKISLDFKGERRPYQIPATDSILTRNMGVLESGTGSGKTVMACYLIYKREQPTLIVVHNKELLYQWQERIKEFLGIDCGLIGDGKKQVRSITVGIINSVRKQVHELNSKFGHLIVDECHRVPSTMFTEVASNISCKYNLGLSATPYRNDGLGKIIYFYMGTFNVKVDSEELRKCGAVLKPEIIQKETMYYFDYRDNYSVMMKDLCKNEERNDLIVQDIVDQVKRNEGTVLVTSDRINHCNILLKKLQKFNIPCELLIGSMNKDDRKKVVNNVRTKNIPVLISTVQLIGEGFDCPDLCSLFITTPIKFSGRLTQVVGRILRPKKGKVAKVFDYIDWQVGVLANSAVHRNKIYNKA